PRGVPIYLGYVQEWMQSRPPLATLFNCEGRPKTAIAEEELSQFRNFVKLLPSVVAIFNLTAKDLHPLEQLLDEPQFGRDSPFTMAHAWLIDATTNGQFYTTFPTP